MAQYPIPQFIESEGKIMPFLTFRQFFWLVGGGAICLAFYYVLPTFLFLPLAILILLIAAGMAFIKINNESILTALLRMIKFSTGTKNYTWKKKESTYPFKVREATRVESIQELPEIPTLHAHPSKLGNIRKIVETKK